MFQQKLSEKSAKVSCAVPKRLVDERLDKAALHLLQEKFSATPLTRGTVSRLIKSGRITLNGACIQADYRVRLHDTIEAYIKDFSPVSASLSPKKIQTDIPILFENSDILVLDKPASLSVHPAGYGDEEGTVVHWLIARYPEIRNAGENMLRPGVVHRLDKETSGVLIVAKTQKTFIELKNIFQQRRVAKKYVALVYGHMPKLNGEIRTPLMRRSGTLKRFVVQTHILPSSAREALTEYRVLARYTEFDLLEVSLKTGRTHQIRVHLASLGHPVVGDKLYAFKSVRRRKQLFPERHMLHAYSLTLELSSKKYTFRAPLPRDFRKVLSGVDEMLETRYDDKALESLLSD